MRGLLLIFVASSRADITIIVRPIPIMGRRFLIPVSKTRFKRSPLSRARPIRRTSAEWWDPSTQCSCAAIWYTPTRPSTNRPTSSFAEYAGDGCSGGFPYPVYECSGNHDDEEVRNIIRQRHGELYYSINLGGITFQSLDDKPTVESVAYANDRLSALPNGSPIVLFHHRPVSAPGGYISEWNPLAVDAYRDMLAGKNVIAILFGHDHYSRHYSWEGHTTYTPGAVRHSPGTPFPESFLVIHITDTAMTCASSIFGNDITLNGQAHVWRGGAWGWTHQKAITTLPQANTASQR